MFFKKKRPSVHFLALQQPPVRRYLHLQVLLDAQQLLVVGFVALHVQTQLRQLVLQVHQRGLKTLHLHRVFVPDFSQVPLQHAHLQNAQNLNMSAS